MNNYQKALKRKKYSKLHFYLFILMMLDFIFTYIGINKLNIIKEGNPILIWLFELPFLQALIIRLLYCFFILILCIFICENQYKHYDKFITLALGVNVIVLLLHLRWAIVYFVQSIN